MRTALLVLHRRASRRTRDILGPVEANSEKEGGRERGRRGEGEGRIHRDREPTIIIHFSSASSVPSVHPSSPAGGSCERTWPLSPALVDAPSLVGEGCGVTWLSSIRSSTLLITYYYAEGGI